MLLVLLAAAGNAQDSSRPSNNPKAKPYALLAGTVWTPEGHSLPGVKVFIRRADEKKTLWIVVSDSRGEIWQRVPAVTQDYVVWTEVKVGKERQHVETTVHVDGDERVDFGLHLKG